MKKAIVLFITLFLLVACGEKENTSYRVCSDKPDNEKVIINDVCAYDYNGNYVIEIDAVADSEMICSIFDYPNGEKVTTQVLCKKDNNKLFVEVPNDVFENCDLIIASFDDEDGYSLGVEIYKDVLKTKGNFKDELTDIYNRDDSVDTLPYEIYDDELISKPFNVKDVNIYRYGNDYILSLHIESPTNMNVTIFDGDRNDEVMFWLSNTTGNDTYNVPISEEIYNSVNCFVFNIFNSDDDRVFVRVYKDRIDVSEDFDGELSATVIDTPKIDDKNPFYNIISENLKSKFEVEDFKVKENGDKFDFILSINADKFKEALLCDTPDGVRVKKKLSSIGGRQTIEFSIKKSLFVEGYDFVAIFNNGEDDYVDVYLGHNEVLEYLNIN